MSFTSFRLSVLLRLPQLIVCASMVPQNGFEWRRWVVLCKHATAFLLPLKRGIQPWCSAGHFFSSVVINKASEWSWLSLYLSFPDIFSARGITGLKSLLNFQYSRVRYYFPSPSLFLLQRRGWTRCGRSSSTIFYFLLRWCVRVFCSRFPYSYFCVKG